MLRYLYTGKDSLNRTLIGPIYKIMMVMFKPKKVIESVNCSPLLKTNNLSNFITKYLKL